MKQSYTAIITAILIFSAVVLFSQNDNEYRDPLEYKSGESKYFKKFEESLYSDDRFLEEIKKEDIKKVRKFYRVFYKSSDDPEQESKPETVGFYMKKNDRENNVEITQLSQHVNMDHIPFHIITYKYSEENEDLVQTKIFKNIHGRVVGSYSYYWDEKTKKLIKIERYGITPYLYQMELKNFHEIAWNKENPDKLSSMTFYGKGKKIIEQYHFQKEAKIEGKLKSPIPEHGVGNKQMFIGYLSRYERFKAENSKEKSYYILYKNVDGGLLEEKYNPDGVLLHEKLYRNLNQTKENNNIE